MKVLVHYLFSKNDKIGSRIISSQTDHLTEIENVPSHIAILVHNRWVFESTLDSGVRVIPYSKWLKINQEVSKIPCVQVYREYDEIKEVFKQIKGKKYDWLGIIYFAVQIVLNRYLKTDLPKENKWQKDNKYFCCEAVEHLTRIGPTSMKAPVQLLKELM